MIKLIEQKRDAIAQLCREYGVRRFELFGSAATDTFDDARSDLDFLVDFLPCEPAQHARRYLRLLVGLENLFQRKIDLLEIKAIRNPYFQEIVNQSRVELYAA